MIAGLTPIQVETGFWLILLLGLATGIGIQTDWGRPMQPPSSEFADSPPQFQKPALAEPFHLPDPDRFMDITLRPLFLVTRRPPPPVAAPEPPKPSMQKGQFILTGTIVVGDGKFAFLLEKAGNKSRVVAEGKEINGIMVKAVTKEQVVLSQYDDTEVLVLRTNKPITGATGARGVLPPAPGPIPQPRAPAGSIIVGPR